MEELQFEGFDGSHIHVTCMGHGPAVLLLHGLFSSAETNWLRYGTAERIATAGFRLLLPDLRGHGQSASPAAEAAWPADVLAMDIEALVGQLGLGTDFALGGYSLGARTVARLLARGLRPKAAILAGMGLQGLTNAMGRSDWFVRMIRGRGSWKPGSGEYLAERFMEASVRDPQAMIWLLQRQTDTPAETLRGFRLPALVVAGVDDHDNGSANDLAALLPDARYREIPGNHMMSVTRPELGREMLGFLREIFPETTPPAVF